MIFYKNVVRQQLNLLGLSGSEWQSRAEYSPSAKTTWRQSTSGTQTEHKTGVQSVYSFLYKLVHRLYTNWMGAVICCFECTQNVCVQYRKLYTGCRFFVYNDVLPI